jgi:hypothetical protein
MNFNRRDFLKIGAAGAAGVLGSSGAVLAQVPKGIPAFPGNSTDFRLPVSPGFATKHAVVVIYGNGARKKDVVENPAISPHQARIAKEGTLFVEDFGETANLHGYMYTELLSGRDAPSQHPRFPTWTEYIRRNTGEPASKFWMLQPLSYYRAWTWDRKHFSQHPEYGLGMGAGSITTNKVFYDGNGTDPRVLVDQTIEAGLGHTSKERQQIAEFFEYMLRDKKYLLPSTKTPIIDRTLQIHDATCFQVAKEVLAAFKPRVITIQMLGLDDAHADHGFWNYDTDYEEYLQHISATDEMIGNLWDFIQKDPYFSKTTSLFVRPECGRDDEVNIYGQLHHSPGNYYAHYVWMLAAGPDIKKGQVVTETVNRRDICPTLTYAISGGKSPWSTGSVRTMMFDDKFKLPKYQAPAIAKALAPKEDLEALHLQHAAFNAARRTRVHL